MTDSQFQKLQSRIAVLEAENRQLRRSEWRYRQVFEAAPISMILVNQEGYATEINAAAEELYGLTLEQFNEHTCPIFDNPQLVENGTLPYMLRSLAGEAVVEPPTSYDASRDFESGNFNYGRGHYAPIRNLAGAVEGFLEVAPDYSDFFALQTQLLAEKEQATEERSRLLTTVAQVANLLLRASDYTAVLPEVVRLLGEVTGSDRCTFLQGLPEFSDTPNRVRILNEWHQDDIPSVLDKLSEKQPDIWVQPSTSFLQKVLQGETVNFITSELPESDWRIFFEEHHVAALLIVPIMLSEGYWGDISFHSSRDPRLFDEADRAILQVAAESIAAAIERQRQNEALRESEERYRTLFELSNEGIYSDLAPVSSETVVQKYPVI